MEELSRLKDKAMAYFYWIMGLGFSIFLAAVLESVLSKHED